MKMQILYSLVLGSLLCSCHSVNDVMNAEADPGVLREDTLLLLPTGSVDRSQVKTLEMPDAAVDWTQQGVMADEVYPQTKFIQLDDIPGDHIEYIRNLIADDGLYFISYGSHDKAGVDSSHLGHGFAIYTQKGKFVAEIVNEEISDVTSLRLNRKQKEVCLFKGHRIDCYDYKGNYLRTDFLRLDVEDLYFVNGTRLGVVKASDKLNLKSSVVVFDAEGKPQRLLRQPSKTGGLEFYQTSDALYAHQTTNNMQMPEDTIWQITPAGFKAQYAMQCMRSENMTAGDLYSENTLILHGLQSRVDETNVNTKMANSTTIYDLPSGKMYKLRDIEYADYDSVFQYRFTSLAALNKLHVFYHFSPVASSSGIIMQSTPIQIKDAFVKSLKATDPDILTHNKRYEKWVRSLKLDGNPILVIESRK